MNTTLLPARLIELGLHLDVDGTPINGTLSVPAPLDPAAGPAAAMGAFFLGKQPAWSADQMASIARDVAVALRAAADHIEAEASQPEAWGVVASL